jgi:hypothetical protein
MELQNCGTQICLHSFYRNPKPSLHVCCARLRGWKVKQCVILCALRLEEYDVRVHEFCMLVCVYRNTNCILGLTFESSMHIRTDLSSRLTSITPLIHVCIYGFHTCDCKQNHMVTRETSSDHQIGTRSKIKTTNNKMSRAGIKDEIKINRDGC